MHKKTPDQLLEANLRWSQERIAADPDAFAGDDGFYAVEFLPEAQVSHFIEFGHIAPFRPRDR